MSEPHRLSPLHQGQDMLNDPLRNKGFDGIDQFFTGVDIDPGVTVAQACRLSGLVFCVANGFLPGDDVLS